MRSGEEERQIVGFLARLLLALLFMALWLAVLLTPAPDEDCVYYGHDGMAAPCPPPKQGLWPRDCVSGGH